jgi:hypothetical protein
MSTASIPVLAQINLAVIRRSELFVTLSFVEDGMLGSPLEFSGS